MATYQENVQNQLKKSLAEQIYQILRTDIINQALKGGEKLTLKTLQERFGVSSTPIREAMGRLNQEGLITHVTNIGASVVELGYKDINEIYDMCAFLDNAAMRLAMQNERSGEFHRKLDACIEYQRQALADGNVQAFLIHSDDFHDIFYQFAGNSRLYTVCQTIRSQISILTTRYQNVNMAREVVFAGHIGICNAIKQGNVAEAELQLGKHFTHAKQYLLSHLEEIDGQLSQSV